jgi:hypothetical protein
MKPQLQTLLLFASAAGMALAGISCKATGRSGRNARLMATPVAASEFKFPTLATLAAARKRGLAAVSNAGGKEPMLFYINIYPTQPNDGDNVVSPACGKIPTVELGISYDSASANEPPKAAGFYLKPDPGTGCEYKDELTMEASRALDAFIGMRPLDEVGDLQTIVKLEPADFLKMNESTIKLQDMSAWNLFIKTILIPLTMDSAQYQIDALCRDQSISSAWYAAIDGKRIVDGDVRKDSQVCGSAG